MIYMLYAYGGWNEMSYVGAEVRNPEKNLLRALVLGTRPSPASTSSSIWRCSTPWDCRASRSSPVLAADVLQRAIGPAGDKLHQPADLHFRFGGDQRHDLHRSEDLLHHGTEHRLYAWLGRWSPRWRTPVRSLAVQAAMTLALIAAAGLPPADAADSRAWSCSPRRSFGSSFFSSA